MLCDARADSKQDSAGAYNKVPRSLKLRLILRMYFAKMRSPLQFLFFSQLQRQILQLARINLRWRLCHEIHTAIAFRKSHHIADTLFAADQHHQAIKAQRDSAMRRRAEPKGAQ